AKFAASSVLPDPLYFATSGYGHSGRVRSVFPCTVREARMDAGAVPFSTHSISGVSELNELGPTPPPQWNTPGAMNRRAKSGVEGPIFPLICWKYSTPIYGFKAGSAQPKYISNFPPRCLNRVRSGSVASRI